MYQHGRKTRRPRNTALFFGTISLAGVIIIISWLIVRKDIASTTAPKTTVPIISEVAENDEDIQKVEETLFSLTLPADWKLHERKTEDYANYYSWVSTEKAANDRRLFLHINIMPPDYKLVKLLSVTADANKLILGNVSDDCINFAGGAGRSIAAQGTAPFEAKWENVPFTCDPIVANQTIGTGSVEGGIATTVGRNKFFFYYEDHNIRPDSNILRQIVQSFRAK